MDRAPRPPAGEPGEGPRFDDILTRLRSIVERLEGGNLSLEDSLQSFEQGMELCRRGAEILDSAEKKVEVLLAGPPGSNRTAPLAAAEGPRDGSRNDERQDD
jgi:exodeoxyribonuclease VII small subunit